MFAHLSLYWHSFLSKNDGLTVVQSSVIELPIKTIRFLVSNESSWVFSFLYFDWFGQSWPLTSISFSEVNLSGFGYDSDANSCFNNTKGWYVKYRSFDYRDKESDDYELCIDFVDSITFNNKTYTDGSILYLEN